MENFVISTADILEQPANVPNSDCFINLYTEGSEIKFAVKCDEGKEVEMALLLATLKSKECYDVVLEAIDKLENGDEILGNHNYVLDEIEDGENHNIIHSSPLVHPVSVFNPSQSHLFGEED